MSKDQEEQEPENALEEKLTIDDWYKMNHHDWKDVMNEYNDLLAEVKRLRERLMLAESALGEVRACHENGQGNLGEILEHYRDKEGVEMPNVFDEVIE